MENMIKIKVSVFDDGKLPVTCSRDVTEVNGSCPYLYSKKMGALTVCHLFKYDVLNRYKRRGDKRHNTGYIKPCDKCLTAREETD